MFTDPMPGALRVALVGCASRKLSRPAEARVFYTSALFRAAYAYAEAKFDAVLIISAKHGVIPPDRRLRPYNLHLRELAKREREAWGVRAVGVLAAAFKPAPQIVILAGKVYADAITHGADRHGLPRPKVPLAHISGCGRRVRWLKASMPPKSLAQLRADGAQWIAGMRREGNGLEVRAEVRDVDGDVWVVFTGGRRGEHKLLVSASDAARVAAHWEGYSAQCEPPGER